MNVSNATSADGATASEDNGMTAVEAREETLWEFIKTLIYAFLFAMVIRMLVFQPFNIPSASMVPTLLIGDYLYVSKYAYGFSQHSAPFSPPLFDGRIWAAEPKRGDVIVFKIPKDNRTDYIKRLIGLPGDRIQVVHSEVFINGEKIKREKIDEVVEINSNGFPDHAIRYRETMPDGVSYITYGHAEDGPLGNTDVYVVPEGHYFFMGDNRDNSLDSRVPTPIGPVGFVPFENLVGRAEMIFYSTESESPMWAFWDWIPATRFDRIGTFLR